MWVFVQTAAAVNARPHGEWLARRAVDGAARPVFQEDNMSEIADQLSTTPPTPADTATNILLCWDSETGWAHVGIQCPDSAALPEFKGFLRLFDPRPPVVQAYLQRAGFRVLDHHELPGGLHELRITLAGAQCAANYRAC
jgi:hypothetical protein